MFQSIFQKTMAEENWQEVQKHVAEMLDMQVENIVSQMRL